MQPEAEAPTNVRSLRLVTIVLAAATGLSVANIYYSQPLLGLIANAFHTSRGTAAITVTATQLGYAAGIVLLLPLGDLFENRKLTSRTLVVTALVLAGAVVAPNYSIFLILSILIGTTSVVAQILIPLAAHLAPEAERGQFVGRVMSGLLLGILLARTVASLLAGLWGWRSVYLISAVLMLGTAVALRTLLPTRTPDHKDSYRLLMRSILTLARTEPALRRRAAGQAMMFGAFSSFWTSIAFELTAVHHLSQNGIALFALVGAAGAAAAPVAGRLGDRGYGRITSGIAFVLAAGAMVLADAGSHQLLVLAAAGVLLDLAVQGHQVLSQREIYALRPNARARINTVFMGSVFFGGAIASAVSGMLFEHYGWAGATLFGAALALIGLALWTGSQIRHRRSVPAGEHEAAILT